MKPSLGTYIPPEVHKQRMKEAYAAGNHKEPTPVFLGDPRYRRTTTVNDADYDREVEYQVEDPEVLAEMNGVQEARGIKVNVRRNNQLIDEAQRQFEINKAASAGQQWAGQKRWQGRENEEMRKVNVLHCREFVRRMAGVVVRIWLNNFSRLGRIGVNARVLDFDENNQPTGWADKTITTLQYPWSYEWSVMRFNKYDVPTQEKFRGWRTALLVMILYGVCTEQQAHEAFGVPFANAASEFYREQLFNFRNLKGLFERPVSAALEMGNVEKVVERHVPGYADILKSKNGRKNKPKRKTR